MASKKKIKCPACGESFELDPDLTAGDMTYCVDCDQELKIVSIDPPKVKKMVEYPEVCDASKKRRIPPSLDAEYDEEYPDDFEADEDEEEFDGYDSSLDDEESPESASLDDEGEYPELE